MLLFCARNPTAFAGRCGARSEGEGGWLTGRTESLVCRETARPTAPVAPRKQDPVNIALVYLIATLLVLVIAAPVALLAPLLFAVTISLPVETVEAPTAVVAVSESPTTTTTCAPFVRVYAARGDSRPAVYSWSICPATTAPAYYVSKTGKGLRGAALRAATARAGRIACTSPACPTVSL